MRISVVLPDNLGRELQHCKRDQKKTISVIVRDALALYLRDRRRRSAGEELQNAAAAAALSSEEVRSALAALEIDRDRPDRV